MNWRAMIVFHAAGERMEPDRLLKRHALQQAVVYHKGEAAEGGRTHSVSGFKVDLGEVTSKAALQELVLKHLHEHSGLYADVVKAGGNSSLGIGLTMPPKEPRTVTFAPEVLAALQAAGITLHVAAYPCMDEEAEAEAAQQALCT